MNHVITVKHKEAYFVYLRNSLQQMAQDPYLSPEQQSLTDIFLFSPNQL